MIRFTYCKNFATAETKETEWEPFAKTLTTFKAFPSKEASVKRAAFVGGVRADEDKGRADGNIVLRTVATLDFDAPQGTLDDIEFALQLMLPCAFVAYSTFRHTPEAPRLTNRNTRSRSGRWLTKLVLDLWITALLPCRSSCFCPVTGRASPRGPCGRMVSLGKSAEPKSAFQFGTVLAALAAQTVTHSGTTTARTLSL